MLDRKKALDYIRRICPADGHYPSYCVIDGDDARELIELWLDHHPICKGKVYKAHKKDEPYSITCWLEPILEKSCLGCPECPVVNKPVDFSKIEEGKYYKLRQSGNMLVPEEIK